MRIRHYPFFYLRAIYAHVWQVRNVLRVSVLLLARLPERII